MAKKVRLTNFARFFIFLVIIVPAAYAAASYINGEDPVQNIKNILKLEEPAKKEATQTVENIKEDLETEEREQESNSALSSNSKEVSDLKEELKFYKNKVKRLEQRVEELEKENFKLKQN